MMNIRLKFDSKIPNTLKVIAFYSTTNEPKLARCRPRTWTISPMRWEQSPVARFKKCLLANFVMHSIQIFRQNA